ncbi:hypothetical protein D3C77_405570 [compost metagenome]
MEYVFDFVQQFLGSAEAECRNHDGALVRQCSIDGSFKALLALHAVRVQAVAVGAFEYQDVGTLRRLDAA